MHVNVPFDLIHTPSYDTFRSPEHARRELENVMLRAFNGEYPEPLEIALAHWRKVYKNTALSSADMTTFAYTLLELYYHVAVIIVGTYGKTAMAVDSFDLTYLDIVRCSISIYKALQPGGLFHGLERSNLKSTSDIGWIAPLYITAISCRNPRLRHQSIRLLDTVPHKEGIFDSGLATTIAREICNIEGQDCWEAFDVFEIPSTEVLAMPRLPSLSRISNPEIGLPTDPNGILNLSYNRNGRALCRQCDINTGIWSYKLNFCPVKSSLRSHNFSAAP